MPVRAKTKPLLIWTIGHSTRELPAFIELLRSFGVKQLVDVRTMPRSRWNPQYNLETLPGSLAAAGIRYAHLPALGGLRRARRDSPNMGWRNASFRGFADYMQQPEFQEGLERLSKLAAARPTAIMCAEAVPWRCHRSLIADALLVRGARVEHIISGKRAQAHSLSPFARIEGGGITYPATTETGPGQPLLPGIERPAAAARRKKSQISNALDSSRHKLQ
ncbi:MAG: DUF488 family protein [Terriglobia bacterium]